MECFFENGRFTILGTVVYKIYDIAILQYFQVLWNLLASMNRCHLCKGEFFAPSFKLLLFHIGHVHASSPDFYLPCGIDNCQVTFTNFHDFKRHLRKKYCSHLSDIEAEHDLDRDITDRDSAASSTTLEPSGDVSDYFMGDDETLED